MKLYIRNGKETREATPEEVAEYMRGVVLTPVEDNLIIDSDSYKPSHWTQYPKGSEGTFYYLEARGSERDYDVSVWAGLQYILKRYFSKPITKGNVEEAKTLIEAHGEPFNYDGWMHIVNDHGGKLPLHIRAVQEGTVVPTHNALMTVETTCPKCFWVGSYFETALMRVWYPITVATQSYYLKKLIYSYLEKTSDDPDAEISFKLHDFGSRGVSSQESAGIGGFAHLLSFMGTDTMQALKLARDYYHEPMAGFSIPAGEHSTFSSWGRAGETDAYRNMLKQFGQAGKMFAVVSDTWDIFKACRNIWGKELKQEVIDSGATVVIRPDSGDPVKVLCGYKVLEVPEDNISAEYGLEDIFKDGDKYYEIDDFYSYGEHLGYQKGEQVNYSEDEIKGVLQILAEEYGYTTNSKGYKVINNIRVIQGDGVNPESIAEILETMEELGFSATNIAFGMGGALLQKVNRDTLKMAYKCSAIKIDGVWQDVFKDPITDSGKRSKKGRLMLTRFNDVFETAVIPDEYDGRLNQLITYYKNGEILVDDNLKAIRERLALTKD